MFKKKHHALTHSENRMKLCLFWLKKSDKLVKIEEKFKKKICSIYTGYHCNDYRLPTGICVKCRVHVYEICNKKRTADSLNLPDYSAWTDPKQYLRTYSEITCQCTLCEKARSTHIINFMKSKNGNNFNKCALSKQEENTKASKVELRKWKKCLTDISPGRGHQCTKVTHYSNIKKHAMI